MLQSFGLSLPLNLIEMSAAFCWTIEEVEYHVVNVIQSGIIQGHVDSQNKVREPIMPFFSFFFF